MKVKFLARQLGARQLGARLGMAFHTPPIPDLKSIATDPTLTRTYLPSHLPSYLHTHQNTYLSTNQSIYLPTHPTTSNLHTFISTYLHNYISHPKVYLLTYQSHKPIYLPNFLLTHLHTYIS